LWDWDLARGRIFWSHSMFDILGLPPRDDLLTFGEVSALVHPADVKLYELAAQLADATTKSIDRAFRMRHAAGDWVWLRARCELVVAAGAKPVMRTHSSGDRRGEHARTFEARLEDGRWLHISERRTKDGGFVSVGTDITALKRHEEQLLESERRLMATVADLRSSQHALERQTEQLAYLAEKYAEQKDRAEEANQAK